MIIYPHNCIIVNKIKFLILIIFKLKLIIEKYMIKCIFLKNIYILLEDRANQLNWERIWIKYPKKYIKIYNILLIMFCILFFYYTLSKTE